MGTEIDALLGDLKSADETDRRYAAEDLGEMGDKRAVPALIEALADPLVAVREAAADALIAIGGKEVATRVAELLGSEDVWIRNYATEILEELGSEAIEPVKALCKSESSDVRKFAVDILGKIGEINELDAFEEILELLDDKNINVAAAAAEALGKIGDPAAIPVLAERINGPPWLQCNVIYAIAQIGGEGARSVIEGIEREMLSQEAVPYYEMALTVLKGKAATSPEDGD